jgi:hypothetical protein
MPVPMTCQGLSGTCARNISSDSTALLSPSRQVARGVFSLRKAHLSHRRLRAILFSPIDHHHPLGTPRKGTAMTRLWSPLYIFLVCGTLAACATTGRPGSGQPTSAAQPLPRPQTQSHSAGATRSVSSTSPAHSSASPDLTPNEERLISQGYHLEVRDGEKTFCRREAELGSHFERKVCGTAEQLGAITQTSRDVTENAQRSLNPRGN